MLAEHLRGADAAVVMKLGRRFDGVRAALELAEVDARGVYVERASRTDERVAALDDVEGEVPYMALVLVPTARHAPAPQRAVAARRRTPAAGSRSSGSARPGRTG